MKVGVGYCDDPETMAAGIQATAQAICQAGRTDPCSMVLLFSTAQHDPAVLREAVLSVVGESVPIYGGGTAGVITNDYFGYAGNQIGLACIWLDDVRCDVLVEGGMEKSELETGIRLGQRLAELGTDPESPVMLFYDAVDSTQGLRLLMATYLLDGIEKGLGFSPNLSGVGMIGDMMCSSVSQWTGSGISDFNALAMAFSGDIRMDTVILHGCRPSTQYYTVTKAAGPVILEINGKPAIQFVDELLHSAIPPEQYPFYLIFGINHGKRWEYNEDYYASRLCLAIDKANGGIVMFEPDMVEGTEFQIMFRTLELDYVKPRIEKAFTGLEGREPVFGVYINCAGRSAGYGGMDLEDAPVIQQTVAGRVPILGLYNGVEIAPIGGRPRGLDWTGIFCLFSKSSDGSGIDCRKAVSKPIWEMDSMASQSKEIPVGAMVRICEQNAAKILSLDIASVAIRLELEQKRRGFSLLAELSSSLRQQGGSESVFVPVAKRINAALNMQRTVVLEKKEDGLFSPVVLQGYSTQEKAALAGCRLHVPPELLDPNKPVQVTGADPAERFRDMRELLGLPYFVSSPVVIQGEVIAILLTGRLVEAPPYLIRLGNSDGETIQAIAALLASVHTEQRLIIAEERNRIMMDAAPICCVFWDENGNLTDCNQETLSVFGFQDKKEFLEKFFTLDAPSQPEGFLSLEEGTGVKIIMKAFVTGGSRFKWMHVTVAGELLPMEVTLVRVPKGDGYIVAGYMRDLRGQDTTEKYAKVKNEFLASVSHEIRTPLNAIQAMAHTIGELKNIDENQQININQGLRSITLLTSAIEAILDFSKLDSGQLSLEASNFSIRDLVEGICEVARNEAEEKSLSFRFSVDVNVPDLLSGDSARLQQALFNLVMNAIKFTETGSVDIHVFQGSDVPGDGIPLIFEVRDTGIGISEQQMANLFKPLYSADAAYTRKHSGLGMGLAVSNGLVTLMGGQITCESRLGEGTTFKIHITLSLPEKTPLESVIQKGADTAVLQGMRVLVAEDNKINQMIMKGMLSSVGVEISMAENGIEALEKLQESTFDLILMDVQMPEMDGLTTTAQIRLDPQYENLPILAVSANAGAEFEAESLRAGMNDHLTKPVDAKKLYAALKKWFVR